MHATPNRPTDGVAPRARGPFPLPLVGRDAELSALASWLDDAAGHIRPTARGTVVDPVRSPNTGLLYIGPDKRATVAAR